MIYIIKRDIRMATDAAQDKIKYNLWRIHRTWFI